jgi:glutaredoxin 3
MAEVIIYTTPVCPYCVRAKMLLKNKKVSYKEIDVSNPVEREKMIARSNGKRSVPQIFIGDTHVGGSDDLYFLEQQGKLDSLLAS